MYGIHHPFPVLHGRFDTLAVSEGAEIVFEEAEELACANVKEKSDSYGSRLCSRCGLPAVQTADPL